MYSLITRLLPKVAPRLAGFVVAYLLVACSAPTQKNGQPLDTPTTGQITIAVDEVALPITRSTIATFESTYTHAKIKSETIPQEVGFQLLLQDSVRLVVGSRKLNDAEKAAFVKRTITPHEYEYAHDAIAVILHPTNTDTLLTLTRLKGILEGQTKTWPAQPGLKIVPVLESGSGANATFLKSRLALSDSFSTHLYATGQTEKVLEYVAANKGAIGFIGVGYVSDLDSPKARAFLQTVNVVSLSEEETATEDNAYAPFQAYLQLKKYPLTRLLYIVSGEARSGLGTGFASWALSEKGQRIVLKAGLLPATMPVRVVQINTHRSFSE